jgi:hypothetical protein
MSEDHQDKELDPKRLKFGMSPKTRKELEAEIKKKIKKRPKSWRPEGH